MSLTSANPLPKISTPEKKDVQATIEVNSRLSFGFLLLLAGSTIICTLGLLMGEAPVVIGGMIISPLMWPLIKTALGISYGRAQTLRSALVLLLVSVVITLVSAMLITWISPIKSLNTQILALTNPTFFNIIIGLVAGGIATFAISHPRVSENLAGIAVATSLLPPLCTAGIGLALNNYDTAYASFLLFLANAVSIVFISAITFTVIGFKRQAGSKVRNKGLAVTAVALLLLAIPLYGFLKDFSFQTQVYDTVQTVLRRELSAISPQITLSTIQTNQDPETKTLKVTAEILLPEEITIDFSQQQALEQALQAALETDIALVLRLQRAVGVVTPEDKNEAKIRSSIRQATATKIRATFPNLQINSLDINLKEKKWHITAVLRGNPSSVPTQIQQELLQKELQEELAQPLVLSLELIPRLTLPIEPDQEEELIKETISGYLSVEAPQLVIESVDVTFPNQSQVIPAAALPSTDIAVVITYPPDAQPDEALFMTLKEVLEKEWSAVKLEIKLRPEVDFTL